MLHLYFDLDWDSIRNRTCPNLVPHGYVVTTSINCIDRWFCTANDISIGKIGFHSCLESRSRISAEIRPYATSLAFSPPCCSHSVSRRKHIESRIGFFWKSEAIFCLDCILRLFQSERVVYTLPWPWSLDLNFVKVVGNHTREMFVDSCRLLLFDSPESI
jgi:hypothetical protein